MYVIRYFYCCLLIALCLVCLLTGLLLLSCLRACWFDGYAHVLILGFVFIVGDCSMLCCGFVLVVVVVILLGWLVDGCWVDC